MNEIHLVIAKNLKAYRDREKLSLEKTAELTGVSKTMIGQIERGESVPTITTLWKMANGLKIPFTALIKEPEAEALLVSKDDKQALSEDDGKYKVYPCFPFEDGRPYEVYTVEIEKGGFLKADPHKEGTEELFTVFEGEVTLSIENREHLVKCGDSIRFKADKPHSYLNSGKSITRLSMVLFYLS